MKTKIFKTLFRAMCAVAFSFALNAQLPAQDGWERMADMPQATSWYGSCIDPVNEKAYIFGGGHSPGGTLVLLATTQIYDFKTDTWSFGADMPNAASSFSAEMVDGKIYIIGEYRQPHTLTTVTVYDPVEDIMTENGLLPGIFLAHGSSVYNGLIYLFGGRGVDPSPINTVRTYDPLTDTWNKLGDMPYKRMKSAVCIYNDEIYLFGDNPSLKYNPSNGSWTELDAGKSEILAYAVPIIDDDRILLFGGYKSGDYPNPSDEVWAYYPATDLMVKYDVGMPFNRFCNGYKYDNYVYLFGGNFANTLGSVTNEVWRFNLDHLSVKENEYLSRSNIILNQNYPNPFLGSTVINYELLEPAFISIDIFDVLGKKMEGLINEFQGTGKHEIEWNINGLSSGIYFGVLSDGTTQQHVKMHILK